MSLLFLVQKVLWRESGIAAVSHVEDDKVKWSELTFGYLGILLTLIVSGYLKSDPVLGTFNVENLGEQKFKEFVDCYNRFLSSSSTS